SGMAEGVIHPSLLATLVYRFGIPGQATDDVAKVQANGQCFLLERETLDSIGGFTSVQDSVCEDVTLARPARHERIFAGHGPTGSRLANHPSYGR
ncbi:MAG TPA: glycosyltransferase, partial [Thermomicrobiales bacterium]|nr:glycosyltransferase [Thermomicrobiales bacterium]